MPTVLRAQVILKHDSGLPRDAVTNTFWFDCNEPADEAEAEDVAESVRDFYVQDPGEAQLNPIMNYLSPALAATAHEIKVTPIDVATGLDTRGIGFPPLWVEVFDFIDWTPDATPLPSEVSCCLSYKNLASGSVPPARRRGRIYVGSLGNNAGASVGSVRRPSQPFREDLIAAANLLQARQDGGGNDWIIYSRPYEGRDEVPRPGNPRGPLPALPARAGSEYLITDFWVDNAFDTQRKRGEAATLRTVG